MNYPQRIIGFILDTVFPVVCLGCGSFSTTNRKNYLCKYCLQLIPIKKDLECIGCRIKSSLGKTCIGCQSWSLDHLFVVSDYKNKVLEKTIKTLKYRFVRDLAESIYPLVKRYVYFLAKEKRFSIIADNPVIIPVPLHYRRFNWRGFNQAQVIAKIIAGITNLRTDNTTLIRSSISKPQAEINKKSERLENMSNQFKISTDKKIKGKAVLLADDICTTGATLNECARILKKAGAKKVIGFVIARG